tara:strand:+ start:348 stop:962 length:615 start_codon:yes stop_codon:yes gene_type:complete
MTKIFVISMETEVGKSRREKLKYEYEWFKANDIALDFIKDKMIHFWSAGEKNRKGKEGCFDSYYRLFKKIYDEKIDDVIINEDDCRLIKLFKVLPNKLCYLNGLFINSDNWKKYNEFNKENGVNEIDYSKSRILGTWGIYVPKYTDVKPIIDMIENSKRIRAIDIMLMKNQLIKNYLYPSSFYIDDGGFSQINNKISRIHKNYT